MKVRIHHACGHDEMHAWPRNGAPGWTKAEFPDLRNRIRLEMWEETICERPCSGCNEQPRFVAKDSA